ncbi:MAG: family 16 glycoside hydrolase [Pirellulaceae bacterium]
MISMLLKLVVLTLWGCMPQQEPLGEYWGTAEAESKYYKLVDVPLPKELAIEAGSFEVVPESNQLAIATRRGDIFLVDGAFDQYPEPTFHKYAEGLDEIFGIAWNEGAFTVTQQTEVSRIRDLDGDGRADRFETLSDEWGFRNYHEFAFGSKPDPEGNTWVALCLSESYNSKVPFRGWCLKVTPDGKTIPICSGIRSPCGIGPNEHGVMFYAESQGPWNGSCSLKVLQPGGFMGHPISFNWYDLAPELGPAPVAPNTPSRLEIERQRVKELVPYAVVFPYIRMGRSISGFMVDRTGGKFGPFENQIFIGDFSLGIIMRATTEQVNGVWQGACYPFREGFGTGLLAVQFTPNGQLIAGGTNRGWPVRGSRDYAVERLDWTGLVPFEIREITARPKGFHIEFTKPVDAAAAGKVETYQLATFTHIYQQGYGSPEVDQTKPIATGASVAEDRLSVDIEVAGLVQGHVHEFHLQGMKSTEGESLLHADAYYTLNEIPLEEDKNAAEVDAELLKRNDELASGMTRDLIDFMRPADAVQLIGPDASLMVPEKPEIEFLWSFANGVLTASPKWDSAVTPESYRDFRMHVEFNVNEAGEVEHERDGNSGVYIQQRYELQILNSFGISEEDYRKIDCGSLYQMKKPDRLVCRPAGEWQTFDIVFRAARFEQDTKTQNARITVYQNGELIHDDVLLPRHTGAGKKEGPEPMPIKLQGHHNQVAFRNLWIQPLDLTIPEIRTTENQNPQASRAPIDEGKPWLHYVGKRGPGRGKHIVLIAAEQEYRSEESMPMLAKVLSEHHGFDCTVLFSMNADGEVDPTLPAPFEEPDRHHFIPGLEQLRNADCLIWLSRFMQLPDDQIRYFHEYFDSGKPIIALRTANHGFWRDNRYVVDNHNVSLREMLGGTFMEHHGGWHRESTRGEIDKTNRSHPILTGVNEIWGTSDVYRCHNEQFPVPEDCTVLVHGQPLVNLEPGAPSNADKEPLPIAWTKDWVGNLGRTTRIFHFTMGSGEDFANEGVRRLTINGVYWG